MVALQPLGAAAETIEMPGGAEIRTATVARGGRSFATSKASIDSVLASTNGGETVTCAPAAPVRASAVASAMRARFNLDPGSRQAKVPGDHHPLNLVRAFADLENLLVAVEP